MTLFAPHVITPDSALGGMVIEKSLRFNGQAESTTPQLRRTGTTTSSSFSIAMWAKLSRVSDQYKMFFSIGQENDANAAWVSVLDGQNMGFQGGNGTYTTITRLFRDPTSWFHFLISVNSNNFTVYIDGTSVQTGTIRSLDTSTNGIRIGANYGDYYPWNGYLADVYLIDGQAKAPTDFGYTESQTGIWRPKKYTGTFGTGGAHLEFKDSSSVAALGKDTSGNGNDFTPTTNGFSVTDSMIDSPSSNFCAWNSAAQNFMASGSVTFTEGNLKIVDSSGGYGTMSKGTFEMESGKWYWEVLASSINSYSSVGLTNKDGKSWGDGVGMYYFSNAKKNDTTTSSDWSSYGASYADGDIIGVAFDADNESVTFYKNNSSQGAIGSVLTQANGGYFPAAGDDSSSNTTTFVANFGQDSSFAGAKTAQGNTDGNGIGDFYYSPPSGYKALNSKNLPPNVSSIVRPKRHFDVLTWTGNDSSDRNIEGLEFQPDMVWIKNRDQSDFHVLQDSVRGANKILYPNDTDNEQTDSANGHVNYFTSGGFNVDAGSAGFVNENSEDYVAWCWKAGGAAVSNSDGSITSSVSVNEEAGFSVVTWTGNATAGATVGHGLGKAPACIFLKGRNFGDHWAVYHTNIGTSLSDSNRKLLKLNDEGVSQTSTSYWNDTSPTASVFSLGTDQRTNKNTGTFVAYCWAEIPGYSKFGQYEGNGNVDGTFVNLGFRPALVIFKSSETSENWQMKNSAQLGYNDQNHTLFVNNDNTEYTTAEMDFLSNGFKLRNGGGGSNGSNEKLIYMAWAEQPGLTPFDTFTSAR